MHYVHYSLYFMTVNKKKKLCALLHVVVFCNNRKLPNGVSSICLTAHDYEFLENKSINVTQ